ncbi:MAG: DUF928 domain-containing protein [Cyanobacteria bacterium P01_D01_bin.73]
MLFRKLSFSLTLASALLGALVIAPSTAQEALSGQGSFQFNEQPGSSVGFMPSDRRMPIRTASGGRRGSCMTPDTAGEAVVPLLPSNGGALSATDSPSFWVYVPAGTKGTANFRLTNENQSDINHQSVVLPEGGGLVKVELGDRTLAAGETYQWFFSVNCAASEDDELLEAGRSRETFVTGWVRYEPLTTEVAEESPLAQAVAFARLGYWHDSLELVANLQQSGAGGADVLTAWDQLLSNAGLTLNADGSITSSDLVSSR